MNSVHRLVSLSLLMILASFVPAMAQTRQTAGSNIAVFTCDPHRHLPGVTHPWVDPYGRLHRYPGDFPGGEGFLTIDYRNEASRTAIEVDFGLVARQSLIAVAKDVGRFSSGVTIRHEFVISGEAFPIGTQFPYCAVLRVKYSDGSEWRNPNPPPTG